MPISKINGYCRSVLASGCHVCLQRDLLDALVEKAEATGDPELLQGVFSLESLQDQIQVRWSRRPQGTETGADSDIEITQVISRIPTNCPSLPESLVAEVIRYVESEEVRSQCLYWLAEISGVRTALIRKKRGWDEYDVMASLLIIDRKWTTLERHTNGSGLLMLGLGHVMSQFRASCFSLPGIESRQDLISTLADEIRMSEASQTEILSPKSERVLCEMAWEMVAACPKNEWRNVVPEAVRVLEAAASVVHDDVVAKGCTGDWFIDSRLFLEKRGVLIAGAAQ